MDSWTKEQGTVDVWNEWAAVAYPWYFEVCRRERRDSSGAACAGAAVRQPMVRAWVFSVDTTRMIRPLRRAPLGVPEDEMKSKTRRKGRAGLSVYGVQLDLGEGGDERGNDDRKVG